MNEEAKNALEVAASNPKIASAVGTATAAVGASSLVDLLQGWLGVISTVVGIAVGLYVLRAQHVKYKILKRAYDNGETPNLGD